MPSPSSPRADAQPVSPGWILAIDISAPGGGVALAAPEGRVAAEASLDPAAKSARDMLPAVERLLAAQDLERERISALGAALGPGSFTGLRVGLTTAKGIALGMGLPLYGVSSLEAMARAALAAREREGGSPPAWLLPYRDARHGEIFAALFGPNRSGGFGPSEWARLREDEAVRPDGYPLPPEGEILLAGRRGELPPALARGVEAGRLSHLEMGTAAGAVARLAWEAAAAGAPPAPPDIVPSYQRRPRAETEWEGPRLDPADGFP